MNNLRKVLALVLVVATLMGFASMASAAKFDDSAKIVNEEAVDLLYALNIVEGRDDGNFDPTATVTRAEMAKMIAVLVNGGEFNPAEYEDACDFADTQKHWAAGYVAYCAEVDIIDGYEDGTFRPDQKVKIVEAAKMILAALGYEATKAGFIGANWAAQVAAVANDHDILEGVSKLTKEYADRDTAALMMYNGLQATMVKWDNDALIIDGDKVISVGDYEKRTHLTVVDGIEKVDTIELYEDAFGGELVRNPEKGFAPNGDFDAPVVQWWYKGEQITETYAKVKATYTEAVALKKIYSDVCKGVNPKVVLVSVDGVEDATDDKDFIKGLKKNATEIGGQGTIIEVYLEDGVLYIIVKNTYIGTANYVDSDGEEISIAAQGKYWTTADKEAVAKAYVENVDKIGKGSLVLFQIDELEPKTVTLTPYLYGTLNKVESLSDENASDATHDGAIDYITIGNDDYKLNVNAINVDGENPVVEGHLDTIVACRVRYYKDYTGNVMKIVRDDPKADKLPYNFAYVLAARTLVDSWETEGTQAGAGALEVYEAKLLLADGTVVTKEVTAAAEVKVGDIFAYDVKDEVYTLYKPQVADTSDPTKGEVKNGRGTNQDANFWALSLVGDYQVADSTAIVLKDAATGKAIAFDANHAVADDTHELIVNDATVFVIETESGLKTSTFKAYTGVKNIPAVNTGKLAVAFEHKTVTNDDGTIRTEYDVAKVVFVMDSEAVETPEGTGIIAKTNKDTQTTTNVNGVAVTTYKVNAILDGKVVKLTVTEDVYTQILADGANYFKGLKYTDGVVTDVVKIDKADKTDMYRDYQVDVVYTAGVLLGQLDGVNSSEYTAANVPAYIYSNGAVKVGTIADLKDSFAGYAVVGTDGEFVLFLGEQK